MSKKQYFIEPTLTRIVEDSRPIYVNRPYKFVEKVFDLKEGEYLIIKARLIPPNYQSPRKFLKHGTFVEIQTPNSIDEALEENMEPWRLRKDIFDSINSIYFAGMSFKPFADFQNDKRERRVRLVEKCEAIRILSYGAQTGNDIIIRRVYADSERVSKDGAIVAASVPSRTEKQPRYEFNIYSIVVDSNDPNSYAVANGFWTDIKIPVKRWSFRFNFYTDKEDSNVLNIFAPEIAAYYKFMTQELHKEYKPNKSVVQMSPFGIPTKLTIDYYQKLLSKVVIYDSRLKSKDKLRKLNKAEQEVMLWALVKKMKYDKTFFRRREKRDGLIEEIDWMLLKSA